MRDIVKNYLENKKIKTVCFATEILDFFAKTDKQNIEQDFVDFMDTTIPIDLSITFSQPVAIWYRDVITLEILDFLHRYFRNKCCDIENIFLITSDSLGLSEYHQKYCDLNCTKSFTVIEIPGAYWYEKYFNPLIENSSSINFHRKDNISAVFSCYGGTYENNPPDKSVIMLSLAKHNQTSHIESMAKCADWSAIENYLEYLTYFKDAKGVETYKKSFDKYVDSYNNFKIKSPLTINQEKQRNEHLLGSSYTWQVDKHCFSTVVRESQNTNYFGMLSEKTLRCFLYGNFVLPVNGHSVVKHIEDLGFVVDIGLIDYSYLNNCNLYYNMQQLDNELDKLNNLHSTNDLQDIWNDNYKVLEHNFLHVLHSYKSEVIEKRLKKAFG